MRSPSDKSKLSLYDPFRESLVPSCPYTLKPHDLEAIEIAIRALHERSEEIKSSKVESPQQLLQSRILRHWEAGLLNRMVYLFYNHHPVDGSRWDVISYVSCVLSYSISNHWDLLNTTYKDSIPLAFKLWESTEFDYMQSEYSPTHGWWAPFLTMMGVRLIDEDDKEREENQWAAGTIDLIAHRVMRSDENETKDTEYSALITAMCNIMILDNTKGAKVNRIIRRVVDLLHWMVVVHLPKYKDGPEHNTCIHMCYTLFLAVGGKIEKANTIDALCEAIHSGLLETIVKFSKKLEYIHRIFPGINPEKAKAMIGRGILYFITHYIPQFICYDSVQKAMKADIEDEAFRSATVGTAVEEPWIKLRKFYRAMVGGLEMNIAPLVSLCDNPSHGIRRMPSKLYRCAGCESSWYCSTECQKAHWDNTHKKDCNKLRSIAASSSHGVIARRDCISALRQTIMLVHDQRDKIRSISRMKYPGKNMSQLSILVNYAICPPGMPDVVLRDRAAAKAALAAGSEATVVQCVVPLGKVVATITAAGDISEMGLKVWFAGRSLISYSPAPILDY